MPRRKRTLALELSGEAEERLAELEVLSNRVEAGDKGARGELQRALCESSPAVVAEAAELARKGQWGLIKTAATGKPLEEEALVRRLDLMRLEIAGENPSALEGVLTEKIVGTWMLSELLDLLVSAQLVSGGDVKRMAPSALKPYLAWQAQAHRRLLSTIKVLATVRRLQSGMPNSQTNNVQINLSATNHRQGE